MTNAPSGDDKVPQAGQTVVPAGGPLPEGLPPDANRRLAELEDRPGHKGMFTSDLSVNEFLLIKEVGFHPLGFVMGSSIYHIGIQTRRWSQSQELSKLTGAMYEARQLAMARMQDEANELGASGIVGVRLEEKTHMWGDHTIEFLSLGTAVVKSDGDHTIPQPQTIISLDG